MRITLFTLVTVISVIFQSTSQTKDVTRQFKTWYDNSVWTYKPEGANLNDKGILHLSLLLDDYRTIAYQMDSGTRDKFRARRSMVTYALFFRARDVFKLFPTAAEYNVWAVHYPVERDQYGNEKSKKREVIGHLRITRATVQRINWDYLDTLWLEASFRYDIPEILRMLDFFNFNSNYFINKSESNDAAN